MAAGPRHAVAQRREEYVTVRYSEQLYPLLPPLRRASRNGRLYTGPCPFCPDGGDDRFHVWMEASAGRPAERYWCRVCNARGLLRNLDRNSAQPAPPNPSSVRRTAAPEPRAEPNPAHTLFYRELYQATACWAHSWLLDGCHPDPLRYLHRRGLSDATIGRYLIGVTLGDPDSLVAYLRSTCPEAFPYAEEAGLLARDDAGNLRAHWNLCGRILFPYIAGSQVVDLRTRTYDGQKGYRSLGPYAERGASFPFAWDSVAPGTTTVIVAEAELKALIALQAFHAGDLAYPTIGQPGLTVFRPAWAEGLQAKGVREVVLCYDSQPRRAKDGLPTLTPEEQWCLRHGATCAAAGMQVRIACLPLPPDADKAEIDTFIPEAGAAAFQQLIDSAPLLSDYHRSISKALLERHNLPLLNPYPTRRPRPLRQSLAEAPAAYTLDSPAPPPHTLPEARAAIAVQAEAHASAGMGFLVLAHPPGIGKGQNTTLGLRNWLQKLPPGATGRPFLVWTALRKGQLADQEGIALIPLDGRGPQNCGKLPEASTLVQKGYGVKEALCMRRCPHLDHCAYLRQFGQVGDFFAATPLLRATGWWQQAGLVVLDEFDPSSLISHVQFGTTDLAAMSRANAGRPAIQTVLRWVAQVVATTTDRTLVGGLFLDELARQAAADAAPLDTTLQVALEELPPVEQLNLLSGLPNSASLADYQALPPAHTPTLLHLIVRERGEQLAGRRRTSRLEARAGRLELYLRVEHLIAQLCPPRAAQARSRCHRQPRVAARAVPYHADPGRAAAHPRCAAGGAGGRARLGQE